jgi:hypothetical protein
MAVVGVLATLLLYAVIAHLQALGESAAAQAMPDMGMKNMTLYWSFPRSSTVRQGSFMVSHELSPD